MSARKLGFALCLSTIACDDYVIDSVRPSAIDVEAVLALEGDAEAGELIFYGECRKCHDAAGRDKPGKVGPGLAEWVATQSKEDTLEFIAVGQPPFMPPLIVQDEQELADLLAWMDVAWQE